MTRLLGVWVVGFLSLAGCAGSIDARHLDNGGGSEAQALQTDVQKRTNNPNQGGTPPAIGQAGVAGTDPHH